MSTRALILCGIATVALASIARGEGPHGYTAEEARRLRQAVNLDNWDDGGELSHFTYLNTSQVFPVALIRRGGPIRPLPVELNPAIGRYVVDKVGDRSINLDQFLGEGSCDGFVVVHRGRIVYEVYPRMQPEDRHLMFSVSKAFVGTVVAILEDRGRVRIDRPASEYLAELKGTAWEKTSIRDILEMASGIEGGEWTGEPYKDPAHKHYQLEASLGTLPKTPAMPDSVQRDDAYRYLLTLGKVREPGVRWEYTSANTIMLGWLVERLTGKPLADAISDEIWSRMGAEGDAQMIVSRSGVAVAHAGMVSTLRDLARFGMLFMDAGRAPDGGPPVISDAIRARIAGPGRPEILAPGSHPDWLTHVAYQWDGVTNKGDFFKGGFGDQLLYVAPRKDVVIAYFGTNASLDAKPHLLPLRKMVDELF